MLELAWWEKACTIALASISIITAWTWNCKHSCSPSRRAHNSANKLLATPIFLANPTTQLPFSSLIRPPAPARPGFPRDELSVLSFIHPLLGFSHWMFVRIKRLAAKGLQAQWRNSEAWARISLAIYICTYAFQLIVQVFWPLSMLTCYLLYLLWFFLDLVVWTGPCPATFLPIRYILVLMHLTLVQHVFQGFFFFFLTMKVVW